MHLEDRTAVDRDPVQRIVPVGDDGIKNLMDWRFGPDGALYVLDYGRGFFTSDSKSALWRVTYEGCGPTPAAGQLARGSELSGTEESGPPCWPPCSPRWCR